MSLLPVAAQLASLALIGGLAARWFWPVREQPPAPGAPESQPEVPWWRPTA